MRCEAIEYIKSVLLGGDGSEPHPLCHTIHYGPASSAPASARIAVLPDHRMSESSYGTEFSLPDLPLEDLYGIPLLYGRPRVEKIPGKNGEPMLVSYGDILASSYFLLTRYEEIARREVRDDHGRFPGRESLPHRAGFLTRPIVDEYGVMLRGWLRDLGVSAKEPGGDFKVALTHDIDVPYQYLHRRQMVMETLGRIKNLDVDFWKPAALHLGLVPDPTDSFELLRTMDRRLIEALGESRVSVLYFVLVSDLGPYDPLNPLSKPKVKRLLRSLRMSGATLGIHPSYRAGGEPSGNISREKERLERFLGERVVASRHHYLRWREPKHVRFLEECGIQEDYTLGYADLAGFRLGTCRPVRYFEPTEQRLSDVVVHPLTIMDTTIVDDKYMHLDLDESRELCGTIVENTRRHVGELTLLWHNSSLLDGAKMRPSLSCKIYESTIESLSRKV